MRNKLLHNPKIWRMFVILIGMLIGKVLLESVTFHVVEAETLTTNKWQQFLVTDVFSFAPDIYGQNIVWAGSCMPSEEVNPLLNDGYTEIPLCLYDWLTHTNRYISNQENYAPKIDGTWVAFKRTGYNPPGYALYAKNIVTNEERELFYTEGDIYYDIQGGKVAVTDSYSGTTQLMVFDLNEQSVVNIPFATPRISEPAIYDETVIWTQIGANYSVAGYNLDTQTNFTFTVSSGYSLDPDINGSMVVWEQNEDIFAYDLATQQPYTITQDSFPQKKPVIFGDIILWADQRNGQWDIYGYDLLINQEFQITASDEDEEKPALWGNTAVWEVSLNIPPYLEVRGAHYFRYSYFFPIVNQ